MTDFEINPVYEKIIQDLIEQKYSVSDFFFSDKEVIDLRDSLFKKQEEDNFKKSAIGNLSNEMIVEEIRGDFISWLDEYTIDLAEQRFFAKINDFIDYLNRTCFMGIHDKEFHYAIYPEGTFYKRHLDTFKNDSSRKLSMVCYLNDENWQPQYGGELAIYLPVPNKGETVKNIYPLKGRMVIFESQVLEHEVKPVNRKRFSITGWLKTR